MPSRRLQIVAVTGDALADEDIREVAVPSIVNLWGSCVTKTDQMGLRLNRTVIMEDGPCNVEASADHVDSGRDQLVFNTIVGRGRLRIPIPILTTELQLLLSVEPIL